jgi:hypothetical protein
MEFSPIITLNSGHRFCGMEHEHTKDYLKSMTMNTAFWWYNILKSGFLEN